MPKPPWPFFLLVAAMLLAGCGDDNDVASNPTPPPLQHCADYNPLRNVYFGDLHVHTSFSFDAYVFDVRTTPEQAYRFARGEPLSLPPLDAAGHGTQTIRLKRPLDFAAVTDHSEFLGEVEVCTTPDAPGYDSAECRAFRVGGNAGQGGLGILTTEVMPQRLEGICGADGQVCLTQAGEVWRRIQQAADEANDDAPDCRFTAFKAYEYTANTSISTLHRNVIFRGERVPFPISYIERPTPQGLWAELKATCLDAGDGCDALAIPHNPNESNGKMFLAEYPGAQSVDEERAQAELRASMEPLVEIYQHKGDSECMNGLSGILGAPDELCDFEKRRQPPFEDCGDGVGSGGPANLGCLSRRDFVRGALLTGLEEAERIGANPFRLGVIASTDTHNGTPGAVEEDGWIGHRGSDDATVEARLGAPTRRTGPSFSPGGLAGIWAEENSRAGLFDALRRREVFGTSGPRIAVRFFGGWHLDGGLCGDPAMVEKAYDSAVPMGAFLPGKPAGTAAPMFVVSALRDPGTPDEPGTQLQRLQVIKGWVENGEAHQRVFDVAGDPDNGAGVDTQTCRTEGPGFDSLCTVWTDPNFDPRRHAFYYVRVLENPSCRWNTYTCNSLPPDARPEGCSDPAVPRIIQERAWTSPIWYEPQGSG